MLAAYTQPEHASDPMCRSALAASALLLAAAAHAQPLAFRLGGGGSESGARVAVGPDGTLVAGGLYDGTFDGLPGGSTVRAFVAAVAPSGARRALVGLSGTGASVSLSGVGVDAAGNLYAGGFFGGTVDFDPGPGTAERTASASTLFDAFVASYTATGAFRYAVQIPGQFLRDATGFAAAADGTASLLVTFTGTIDADPGPAVVALVARGTDAAVVSLRADAALRTVVPVLSPNVNRGRGLAVAPDGGLVIAGEFDGTTDFDPGAGTATLTTAGSLDVFVARYTPDGAFVAAFRLGGAGADVPTAVGAGAGGAVALAGTVQGDVDVDPGPGATVISGGGRFAAAYASTAALRLAVNYANGPTPRAVTVAADGSVAVAGDFVGTFDFDPGGPGGDRTAVGTDAFVVSYPVGGSSAGFVATLAGDGPGQAVGVAARPGGGLAVVGTFAGTADADPGAATVALVSAGSTDAFVVAYTPAGGLATDAAPVPDAAALTLSASPNPSRGDAAVVLRGAVGPVRADLYDATGRHLAILLDGPAAADVRLALPPGLPPGVYVVRARSATGTASLRLAVVR